MTYPILDFAATHPWAAFFLAWPTMLVLISVAWAASNLVVSTMNNIVQLSIHLISATVTLIRGYPPVHHEDDPTSVSPPDRSEN